ncbi:class I adenylate-forming enzyme family protein [Brevibacillus dissolubilis]|uniref:class I adenylate-forming enzyme family protein n=1 Tax=Brevibacillus dissolubilis TaxID=1844116 RepID=UPI00159BDCA6|nr:AMP-binding protein [Brevibacillus dissolubilis]
MNTLRSLFLDRVAQTPSSLYLTDAMQSLTYQETLTEAQKRATYLMARGAGAGQRLLIVDVEPMQTALWLLAAVLTGTVFVVLHRDTSAQRMRYLLENAEPIGVVDLGTRRADAYQQSAALRFVIDRREAADDCEQLDWSVSDSIIETDLALMVYTSGSTGQPKGIMCPNRSVIAAVTAINAFLNNQPDDRIGVLLPLSFDYGLYQLFLAMQAGSSVVFLNEFRTAVDLVGQLREHRITGFPGLRSVFVPLVRVKKEDATLPDLRYISNTGDALPPALIEKMTQHFPQAKLFLMYGLSECKRALVLPPERVGQKPTSVGRPIPGTRAYVASETGEPLPYGVTGELVLEGPHVMAGYWKAPEETADKFLLGPAGQPRLRSGDLFYQDEDGDLYFVARKSELIKSRGFRISPREVEAAVLDAHPAVRECLVYGIEDDLLGQAVCADVTVDDHSLTVAEIFASLRVGTDEHLIPTRIRIVESMPHTSSGKYSRRTAMESSL